MIDSFQKGLSKKIGLLFIVPNLICLPFWVSGNHEIILNLQTGFNIFIVPFIICITGSLKQKSNPIWILLSFLMLGFLGNLISYLGWGIWSEELLNPDTETVMIQMFAFEFQFYGFLIAGFVQLIRFFVKKHSPSKKE